MDITLLLLIILLIALQIIWRPNRESTESLLKKLLAHVEELKINQLRYEELIRTEAAQSRMESTSLARDNRMELSETIQKLNSSILSNLAESQRIQNDSLKLASDTMLKTLESLSQAQGQRLQSLSENVTKLSVANEAKLEQIRTTVEAKLSELRRDNTTQLEQMRLTVDEKLQGTLEKRLGESFKQVSERLEQVHRGLGEMQTLATGVGDLKKVLNNVKTRGGWGEVQLGALLEQMLTAEQYDRNVRTNLESPELVEYAIKLPGRGLTDESIVWLPIDSKFPLEDYQRLIEAQERADVTSVEESYRGLRQRVISSAKEIAGKYLNPPATTDFAIMFLPTEGLFAEISRQPGLVEELQSKFRIVLAGPTTFAALLNSLQMGFRTLSIQKQSSEVWKILGEVKTEFGRFGESLDAVKKKLIEASRKMDDVGTRSRAVERRLRTIGELPSPTVSNELLDLIPPIEPETSHGSEE